MDKDNFVLAVPAADSLSEGVTPEQLQELEENPHAGHQVIYPLLMRLVLLSVHHNADMSWHASRCISWDIS